jgi:hypothetical protein
MTDRKLLEAAYAAYRPGENYTRLVNDAGSDYWNPITDDGDALRLMVKLDLIVMIGAVRDVSGQLFLDKSEDDLEATRRAIVRAAAEIGRSMK